MEELQTKKPLIIIGGPTASGKSDLAVLLAEKIGGQIISADSMQVYKYMDIGSAKITQEEMKGVKHYGIDLLEPSEDFNVVFFQNMCIEAMEEIYNNGHIPIITGGTGFYIQAVLYGIEFQDVNADSSYRHELEEMFNIKGADYLHQLLAEVDPESADSIHPNNYKRVIRALEYYKQTGKKISEHNMEQREKISPYNFCYFALTDDRQALYDRIDKRVDIMLEKGLVSEVETLKNMGISRENVSMQGIGYKEIYDYLENLCTLEYAVDKIKQGSRNYAKRQLTWLRREKDIVWLDRTVNNSNDSLLNIMTKELHNRNIIFTDN